MSRIKGSAKTGGRVKGTPNKTTSDMRKVLSAIVSNYVENGMLTKDIEQLDPKDRVLAMEKFAQYTLPKLQSVDMTTTIETKKTIEDTLLELAEE